MSERKKTPPPAEPAADAEKRPERVVARMITSLLDEGEAAARRFNEARERIRSGARVTRHRFRI